MSTKHPAPLAVLVGLLALGATSARAATFTVDDSASTAEGAVGMQWQADLGGPRGSTEVLGASRVQVVLNVEPWVGRQARLFMTLPPQRVASLAVQWRTRGVLREGVLRGGQRVLVYEGRIDAPRLRDTLDVRVQADGRELDEPQRLQFGFEIEVPDGTP